MDKLRHLRFYIFIRRLNMTIGLKASMNSCASSVVWTAARSETKAFCERAAKPSAILSDKKVGDPIMSSC